MRANLSHLGHQTLIYDGEAISDFFVVRSFDMPFLPGISASTIEIDGRPGAWYANRGIGTRDVTIGIGIINDSRERVDVIESWFKLAEKLAKDDVRRLEFGNGYFVECMLVGNSPVEYKGRWSISTLTFRCFDPYIYGEEHFEPLAAGTNTIYVRGNQPTYASIDLRATSTVVQVQDTETSDRVRIPSTMSGANIGIDMELCRCTYNGMYKAADPTVTDFWPLRPGKNVLEVTGGSGSLVYRERYL